MNNGSKQINSKVVANSALVFFILFGFLAGTVFNGCAPSFPKPNEVKAPKPIEDNSGKYLSPYTSDGVVAEWVVKGKNAKIGSAIGGMVGKEVGKKVFESVPLFGGMLGKKMGETAGRAAAIKMCGGWDYMRETTDLSFNNLDDMIVYLYVYYSANEHWKDVHKMITGVYPKYQERYMPAIRKARIKK